MTIINIAKSMWTITSLLSVAMHGFMQNIIIGNCNMHILFIFRCLLLPNEPQTIFITKIFTVFTKGNSICSCYWFASIADWFVEFILNVFPHLPVIIMLKVANTWLHDSSAWNDVYLQHYKVFPRIIEK